MFKGTFSILNAYDPKATDWLFTDGSGAGAGEEGIGPLDPKTMKNNNLPRLE